MKSFKHEAEEDSNVAPAPVDAGWWEFVSVVVPYEPSTCHVFARLWFEARDIARIELGHEPDPQTVSYRS